MTFLIDTGAFYALADESDRHAEAAGDFYRGSLETGEFVSTDAILLETWALIRRRLGWRAASAFLDGVRGSGTAIVHIEPRDIEAAHRILGEYADQELSLVDATSFAVMERMGITHAFAFDKDFLLYRYGTRKQRAFTCVPG